METTSSKVKDLRTQWNLSPIQGHRKCGNCSVCSITIEGQEFTHDHIKWTHCEFTNCKTRNIVYAIKCPCPKLYIGKTTQQANQRIVQHRSRIKNKVLTAPMVQHFVNHNHSEKEFEWTVLSCVKPPPRGGNMENMLAKKEAYLILKFHCTTNGLNDLTELNQF